MTRFANSRIHQNVTEDVRPEGGPVTAAVQNLRYTQSIVAGFGPGRVLGLGDDGQLAGGVEGDGAMHVPTVRLAAWSFTGNARG